MSGQRAPRRTPAERAAAEAAMLSGLPTQFTSRQFALVHDLAMWDVSPVLRRLRLNGYLTPVGRQDGTFVWRKRQPAPDKSDRRHR